MLDRKLNPFWQAKLDRALETCRKQKTRREAPPERRIDPDRDRTHKYTVARKGKEDGDWTYWLVKKDGIILYHADTEEEAYRLINEEEGV